MLNVSTMENEQDLGREEIRELAKKRLAKRGPSQELSEKDASKLIEDLTLHQEELNIQNEELKRIQVELEATRAKYFELYDLAPLGYVTLTPDLLIKEANLGASKLLRTNRASLMNKAISTFISPRSQEQLYLHFRRVASEGEQQNTFTIHRNDGSEILVQFESDLVKGPGKGFRSILTDVTALRRAEEALKKANEQLENKVQERTKELSESEAKYRTIGELIPFGIWTMDAQGRATYISPSFCELVGKSEDDILKFGWLDTLDPETVKRTISDWKKTIETGDFWNYTHHIMGKDGQYRYVLARGVPLKDDVGKVMGWGGVNIDITEQQRNEENLAAPNRTPTCCSSHASKPSARSTLSWT